MEVKLIVVGGKHPGQEVPVAGPKFFIGRSEDCHLRPRSDLISRHHAVIVVEEGFVAVRDFASKNGTFVNGERIRAEQELKTGDLLRIGPLEFEVHLSVPVGGPRKPKVHSVQEAAERTAESGPDDDLDISDWLEHDEESPATLPLADTRSVDTTSTTATSLQDTAAIPDETLVPGKRPQQEPGKKKEPKQAETGRRPAGSKQPTSVDSRAAADEMLRKFFGRKK